MVGVYALSSLRRRFGRVVFTVLGVALSIALTVTMFSIGEGLRISTSDMVERTQVELFVVSNGSAYLLGKGELSGSAQLAADIQSDLGADALTVCPRFEPDRALYLARAGETDAKAVSARGNGFVPELVGRIVGGQELEGEHFAAQDDPFRADPRYLGHNYTPEAFAAFTREVQVNRELARKLGVGPGDSVVVSAHYNMSDNVTCVVRGVYEADFESPEQRTFRMHMSELQYMLKRWDDPASELLIDLAPGVPVEGTKAFLSQGRPYSPQITVSSGRDIYRELEGVYDTFQGFADLIALITIVVAMLFISTVMIISVRERTRELGVLRAIGFSRDSIFTIVLTEGFIIAAVGFALGLALGYIDAWVVDTWIKRTVSGIPEAIHITHITPVVVLEVTLVGMLIGAVAGLLPAQWATRVEVARTLRQE